MANAGPLESPSSKGQGHSFGAKLAVAATPWSGRSLESSEAEALRSTAVSGNGKDVEKGARSEKVAEQGDGEGALSVRSDPRGPRNATELYRMREAGEVCLRCLRQEPLLWGLHIP